MDQESRDANSLLAELDRGLKSLSVTEQTEAVVRFTSLFQKHPLPILINSACLKLAEAFRCSSNYIRVQICEVFEKNQSHLNKIYNVDDFYRNIFTVTTSNDPIARSITLLALGSIAPIVSEYKSIHHCICSSLESSVELELNATIACAACYVKLSSEFACNIFPKMVSIIDSKDTSTEIKIKALSVLDHGFYNASGATSVRSFLVNVIKESKLKRIICTCLTLSTKISHTSLTHIVNQIKLLLSIFLEESHEEIRVNALSNLEFLAEKSPHIWESSFLEPLINQLEQSIKLDDLEKNDQILCIILSIFCKLLTCKCNFISQTEKNRIFQASYKLALDNNNLALCSMAFELLAVMSEEESFSTSSNMIEYRTSEVTADTFTAVKTFLINTIMPSNSVKSSKKDLKIVQQVDTFTMFFSKTIFRHIVKLCNLNPHYCPELIKLVFTKITHKDTSLKSLSPFITELLCAMLPLSSESVIGAENCLKLIKTKSNEISETNLLNLCVFYFQIARVTSHQSVAKVLVDKVMHNQSSWLCYKVMRQAMRYGHYGIAQLICEELHESVTNDAMNCYFTSLLKICHAEDLLMSSSDSDSNLKEALPIYEESISPLRAIIGNTRTNDFQLQFLSLRIRTLQAHATLRHYCTIYPSAPITYSTLLDSICATRGYHDTNIEIASIVLQMPKLAKEFRLIGESYENLTIVSFNCDNSTLDYLQLLKFSCIAIADMIDSIFQYGKNITILTKIVTDLDATKRSLEHRQLETTCNKLIEITSCEVLRPGINKGDDSIQPLINLLKQSSDYILQTSFVYPRYFFQPLQMTQIKLAITPSPTTTPGALTFMLHNNLVLKVEGLIENLSKSKKVIRDVSKVDIAITMTSAKTTQERFHLFMQSTATPHNNYFKSELLISLSKLGSFNIDIEVSIIDEQERTWKTGPTERLNVTVS